MMRLRRSSPALLSAAALAALPVYADPGSGAEKPAPVGGSSAAAVPLMDAKPNIEHNAKDKDTGFQPGFIDSERWRRLDVRGPNGEVPAFEGAAALASSG